MDIFVNGIAGVLIISGLFFFMVGAVGLIRLPDVFSRMHATTKADTLGAGLVLIGVIIWQGFGFLAFNILLILIFIWITNPTAAHFIAKTEYLRGNSKSSYEKDDTL